MSSLTLCTCVLISSKASPPLAQAGCLVCTALARRCQGWKALSSRFLCVWLPPLANISL